jgi:hypothetical protein
MVNVHIDPSLDDEEEESLRSRRSPGPRGAHRHRAGRLHRLTDRARLSEEDVAHYDTEGIKVYVPS